MTQKPKRSETINLQKTRTQKVLSRILIQVGFMVFSFISYIPKRVRIKLLSKVEGLINA